YSDIVQLTAALLDPSHTLPMPAILTPADDSLNTRPQPQPRHLAGCLNPNGRPKAIRCHSIRSTAGHDLAIPQTHRHRTFVVRVNEVRREAEMVSAARPCGRPFRAARARPPPPWRG